MAVCEVLALCWEREPSVATVIDTPDRLITSAEKSAMIGKPQRCSSKIKLRQGEHPCKARRLGLLPPQGNLFDKGINTWPSETVEMGERGGWCC